MRHFEWFWPTDDGARLYAQCWQPDGEVSGTICLVHGHGDHSGRYAHVAAALPHSDEMMALASSGIFSLKYPDHPISKSLKAIVDEIKK